jgi:hypothetical protein
MSHLVCDSARPTAGTSGTRTSKRNEIELGKAMCEGKQGSLIGLLDRFAVEAMKSLVQSKYPSSQADVSKTTQLAYEIARGMLREHLKADSSGTP